MTQLPSEQLADLISKRLKCLEQLRNLGRKQIELIGKGEIGALLRLLSAKNQLIVAVQTIEKELGPFHAQNPDERAWPTESARAKCADQAAQCRRLLEEVMQLEQQNEQLMTLRRDQVANQLKAAQSASAARGAYQAQQKSSFQGPHTRASQLPATGGTQRLDLHSEA